MHSAKWAGTVSAARYAHKMMKCSPGQLSLAIRPWVDAMSTSQKAVVPCCCCWGVKAGMVGEWVAGKTVWSPLIAITGHIWASPAMGSSHHSVWLLFLLPNVINFLARDDTFLVKYANGSHWPQREGCTFHVLHAKRCAVDISRPCRPITSLPSWSEGPQPPSKLRLCLEPV